MKYAILIDGGFVKRKVGTGVKPATATQITDLVSRIRAHDCLAGHELHRIYYYDSKPLEEVVELPLQGGEMDFGKKDVVARNTALHGELSRAPYFALRMGELSFNGWRVRAKELNKDQPEITIKAEHLQPNITQKGVDMRLGMDIAALTLKGMVGILVLVTGDSDFVPAMKFARREGAQLFLVTLGHGVKESMREHSDLLVDIPAKTP
ncbi:NYN domain-containing protein [Diaphorobacter sp. HDW4B]|uniref:NYN domain-containing protein n=1 Tax=Diaphorobacter sp. HDW4B TaxID=2714925 RepID=UPI0014092753|nr:NYN domain-containing protein [Diaphorobacter sp. HDW4B]QIL72290.1 NYN domain-containing protein [Diaphorobacter sp. HDW4B]